jgi:hypothetical protein
MTKLTVTELLVEKKITVLSTNSQNPIAIVKKFNSIAIAIGRHVTTIPNTQ